jgi:serine/threonine protein kinase
LRAPTAPGPEETRQAPIMHPCGNMVSRSLERSPTRNAYPSLAELEPIAPISTVRSCRASGTVIGARYRLDEPIAAGGYAEVWTATDVDSGDSVAIKLMDLSSHNDVAALARFQYEAEVAAMVSSRTQRAVRVLDFGVSIAGAFLVMELVSGRTLAHLIRESASMKVERSLRLLRGLGAAVDAIHRLGIVHRDVKPANVFVTEERGAERVKLTDFGVATRLDRVIVGPGRAPSGRVVGTPMYMSPEQITGCAASLSMDRWG